MSADQLNAFLLACQADPGLRGQLQRSDSATASALAREAGFTVTEGDLIRYKARSTTWQLSDAELAVVANWQSRDQPYWWQRIWWQPAGESHD